MKKIVIFNRSRTGHERPSGEPWSTEARGRRFCRKLCTTVVLVWVLLVAVGASGAAAEVFLALRKDGMAQLVNPHAFNETLVSEQFRPRLQGDLLFAKAVGGGVRLGDGRLVVAILSLADYDGSDFQQGWKLYEYHHKNRTYSVVTPLDGALSTMALGPGGRLFGVTFNPARFVQIDLDHGGFQDLGTFLVDQSAQPEFRTGQSALWYEAGRERFLYAHRNLGDAYALWRIASDGGSYATLDSDVSSFAGPTDFVASEAGLLMLVHRSLLLLDPKDDSAHVIPTESGGGSTVPEYSQFTRNVPMGIVQAPSVVALLPLAGDISCEPSGTTLCLREGDYRVTARWTNPFTNEVKPAGVVQQSSDSGVLWFLEPSNQEALIKVLDACALNGHFWLFGSASTDLAYSVTVEELASGAIREYSNPAGTAAPAVTDTSAFPCNP